MRFCLNRTECDAQLSEMKCAELNFNTAFYDCCECGMKQAKKKYAVYLLQGYAKNVAIVNDCCASKTNEPHHKMCTFASNFMILVKSEEFHFEL